MWSHLSRLSSIGRLSDINLGSATKATPDTGRPRPSLTTMEGCAAQLLPSPGPMVSAASWLAEIKTALAP